MENTHTHHSPNISDFVIIYGGSFNPPTYSHLGVATKLRDTIPNSAVWLMINPQNPFKSDQGMADFNHRYQMVQLLIDGHPSIVAADHEQIYGSRETYDTLNLLNKNYPNTRFAFAMGADVFAEFHRWRGWKEIADRYPLIVLQRNGYTRQALESPAAFYLADLHQFDPSQLRIHAGWHFLEIEQTDLSATMLRRAIQDNAPNLVGTRPEIINYIKQNQLYL